MRQVKKISGLRSQNRIKTLEFTRPNCEEKEGGFTIIELLIATAVFSVVLLLCATAIVQVGRIFYKGTVINRTQNTSRTVVDDVSQAIQFGGGADGFASSGSGSVTNGTITVTAQARCIGDIRYSYYLLNKSLGSDTATQLPHILWKDRLGAGDGCTPKNITLSNPGGTNGQELMGNSMRLPVFKITDPAIGSSLWKVEVTAAYGATDDLFTSTVDYATCKPINVGGQFCAVSPITTYVTRRL